MSQRRSRVLMVENRLAHVFGVRRLAAALWAAACRGSKLPRRKRCQGTAVQNYGGLEVVVGGGVVPLVELCGALVFVDGCGSDVVRGGGAAVVVVTGGGGGGGGGGGIEVPIVSVGIVPVVSRAIGLPN